MELGNLQEELEQIKQNLLVKDNLIKESLETQEMLTQQADQPKMS